MSAQSYDRDFARRTTYGALREDSQLPNGVTPGANTAGGASGLEDNPNLLDPAPSMEAGEQRTGTPSVAVHDPRQPEHPHYDTGFPISDAVVSQQHGTTVQERAVNVGTPNTPRSAMRVQEFFSAESRSSASGQEQQGVRWMARFTEFLRTTASRGATGMDRMLDSFGIHHNGQMGPNLRARVGREANNQLNFSPPEELPEPRADLQVPASWAMGRSQDAPLFSRVQVEQIRQSVRENPTIYGTGSEIESERSSRLQQEVQRQMDEYTARYQDHVLRLEREVQLLRSERQARGAFGPSVDPQFQGNLPQGPTVPLGNPAQVPQQSNLPQGPTVPPGNQAQVPQQSNLPQGSTVPPGNQAQVPQQSNLPQGSTVPPGNQAQVPQRSNLPQGSTVPHGNQAQVPQQSNLPQGSTVPHGNQAQVPGQGILPPSSGVSQGYQAQAPGLTQDEVPQRNGTVDRDALGRSVDPQFRGNLPQGHSGHQDSSAKDQDEGIANGVDTTKGDLKSGTGGSSAQQWLGGQQGQDPMVLLAGGMAQLQQAMLKQLSTSKEGEKSPETVKPGVSQLPMLPPVRAESSSIDIADWLEMLEAPMSDLSDGSASWWKQISEQASQAYRAWTDAGPMERLAVAPVRDVNLEDGRWQRVNSRAASMILLALPENVRSEMVARRLTGSTVSLLFRLMTLYQPGGEAERSRILANLQSPPEESEPQKVVEALRAWDRWLRRCRELSLATPDPTILAKGLNRMIRKIVEQNADMGFRTNLVRSTLQVDTRPSYTSIDTYYKHLMAECEALAVASASLSTTTTSTAAPLRPEPKLKPMKADARNGTTTVPPPPPKPPTSPTTSTSNDGQEHQRNAGDKKDTPCKFFGRTYRGCARTSKCPFLHSWDGLEKEKASRCLACGGKHMAKDCPNKKGAPTTPTGTPRAPPAPKSAPDSSSTTNKTVRIDDKPQVEGTPTTTSSSSTATANELKEVLADVGKMLKAMTSVTSIKRIMVEDDPLALRIKAMSTRLMGSSENDEEEAASGLLDSGASNPMRVATESEYEQSIPVKVTLAGEEERVLRQNLQGTVLLSPYEGDSSQPIVPLGALVKDLGCSLQWKEDGFKLLHPERGHLRVQVRNNCPEVSAKEAHKLIKELEMNQVKKLSEQVSSLTARLEMLQKEESRTWYEYMKEFLETGSRGLLHRALLRCPFTKDLPLDVQAKLIVDFDVNGGEDYLKQLPINRRRRRTLLSSRDWVVKLFTGKTEENGGFEKMITRGGKVLLEVDVANSRAFDINGMAPIYKLLLWAAAKGKISDIIGSPPETTWTTTASSLESRFSPSRNKDHPYGVPDLPPLLQQKLDVDTACVAKQLVLWMCAMLKGKRNVGFVVEFPADIEGEPDLLSFWKTEMWKSFRSTAGMSTVSFYQGVVAHQASRPTTLGTTYPLLKELDGDFSDNDAYVPPSLLSRSSLRKWSKGMETMVAQAIIDYVPSPMVEEEEAIKCGAKLSKLTKDQRDAWTLHLLNDHQPYRADCSICLNAQATGYQHRRHKQPQLYALALDLAGPYKVKGRDMDFDDYKYIMVAAYRCPEEYLDERALKELQKEFSMEEYVPSEGEGVDPWEEDEQGAEVISGGEDDQKDEPDGPITLDEAVEELREPPECVTLYLTRPLRRRTKSEVLRASKEIWLQLKQTGLHVATVHTDRAREFSSMMYKEWLADCSLRHSRTAGGDPAGNSTAELGVKWAKARVRALLKAAGAEARDWPMAIQQATATAWAKVFPHSPTTRTPATPFGHEVWFRAKTYKGTAEKKHDPMGARWKKGWYRGPSYDVNRGHIILREDGGLTVAKSVKFNVVDPAKDLPDLLQPGITEDLLGEPEGADVLLTKDKIAEEVEFVARMMLEKKAFDNKDVLYLFEKLEELGDTDFRVGKKSAMTSWFTGAYVHGGVAGLRNNTRRFPHATKYLVEYARAKMDGQPFTALGITRNSALGLHRDVHNVRCTKNTVIPVTKFEGGGVWVEGVDSNEEDQVEKEVPKKGCVKGKVFSFKDGNPISFRPNLWHEVQPWKGDRVVVLLYTPRASKLAPGDLQELESLGFKLEPLALKEPDLEEEPMGALDDRDAGIEVRRAELVTQEGENEAFVEIDDEDLFNGGQRKTQKPDLKLDPEVKVCLNKMIKKAEVQYTPNIEAILQDHIDNQKPLEVTHTVSLGEVRKAMKSWAPSAKKEYVNLVENKKAFKPMKYKDLPKGCHVVPCKGVFTVKPDGGPEGFRRKTRFVACGNYLAEGELTGSEFDVYAAGLDATSLRTVLAYKTAKPTWGAGVTDIRQAFVLAPWIGGPVALKPPALAVELGLAEEDDYWFVLQSIYGLRESPAAWAAYRDGQLKAARWKAEVEGEFVEVRLQQLSSDNQVWRIVRADDPGEDALGYLLVYIDDLMVVSTNNIMNAFFKWLSSMWECDDLSILSKEHPLKFLGMELHEVDNGIEVSQEGFIREVLRSHQHNGAWAKTQGPKEMLIMSAEEEAKMLEGAPVDLEGKERYIKEAQRRVGEMLWLSSRSRPDLQYATAVMSSRVTRCPEAVVTIGDRLLDYINETINDRLRFANDSGEKPQLRTYTDSSFAPSSGRSHGAIAIFYGTCPLAWRSSRQPLVALSTAETELMEGVEGAVMTYSTKCLLEELLKEKLPITLHIDNSAAISLMTTSAGSWGTRHLRVRANWIREKITLREIFVKHEPGESQRADIGTKPFTKERLAQLKQLWDFRSRRALKGVGIKNVDVKPWITRLLMMFQICGAAGLKEDIKAEIPWDLYMSL